MDNPFKPKGKTRIHKGTCWHCGKSYRVEYYKRWPECCSMDCTIARKKGQDAAWRKAHPNYSKEYHRKNSK